MNFLTELATLAHEMAATLGDPWAGLLTEIGTTIEEFGAELAGDTPASTPPPPPPVPTATANVMGDSPFRSL